jgi:hypothetical protein
MSGKQPMYGLGSVLCPVSRQCGVESQLWAVLGWRPIWSVVQCAVQCGAVLCSVQCSVVQCSAVLFSAEQCCSVQSSAVQCSAVQSSAVQCSAVQCHPSIPASRPGTAANPAAINRAGPSHAVLASGMHRGHWGGTGFILVPP